MGATCIARITKSLDASSCFIADTVLLADCLLACTEWRFFEMVNIRVSDVQKANQIVNDMRRIVRADSRILNKPHKRVFLDKIMNEHCSIYISLYVESANRDAFMAIKQDLLLAFVDCVERNGAKLASPKRTVRRQSRVLRAPALIVHCHV